MRPCRRAPDSEIAASWAAGTAAEGERDGLIAREKAALGEAAIQREYLRETFLQAPVAIARTVGPDHVFELANAFYEGISGRKEAEVLGKRARDVFPEMGEDVFRSLDGVYKTGEPFTGSSIPVSVKRGETVHDLYFDFVSSPVRDTNGSVAGILVVRSRHRSCDAPTYRRTAWRPGVGRSGGGEGRHVPLLAPCGEPIG